MQRLSRKRSATLSSTAEAAHPTSTTPKPERLGLIRKLSQTFSKSSDNDSTEKPRSRKLSLTSIMSSVKSSSSQTSFRLTCAKDKATERTATSPSRVKPEKPLKSPNAGYRMILKPGKHTANRVYAPISLPHSRPRPPDASKKTYKGRTPILKESIRRIEVVDLEFRSSDETLCGDGILEESASSDECRNEIKAQEYVLEKKGCADDLGPQLQPQFAESNQESDPVLGPQLVPELELNDYGLTAMDVVMMKKTFGFLESMGVPMPSTSWFDRLGQFPVSEVTASEPTALPAPSLPKDKQFVAIPSFPAIPQSVRAPAAILAPLNIDSNLDRAPPRQSIPLTPPPMETISLPSSVYNFSTSLTPSQFIDLQPSLANLGSEDSDSDLTESDTDSCYSQSSYHPTVIDQPLDSADKMLLDEDFFLPSNAPPVPAISAGVIDARSPTMHVAAGLDPQAPAIESPMPIVRAPPVLLHAFLHGKCAEAPVPIPVSIPPCPLGRLPCSNQPTSSTARLTPMPAFADRDLMPKTSFTMVEDQLPSTGVPNPALPKSSSIELLRSSSAKESRKINPPSRPYSPEFHSTPSAMPAYTPLSNRPLPSPPTLSRTRLQNQPSASSFSTTSSKSSATSLFSSHTSCASDTTAPTSAGSSETGLGGEVRSMGGLSWKKANGKVSGSWYTPAKPVVIPKPKPPGPQSHSNVSARGVDPKRTYVPHSNGPITVPKSRRQETPPTRVSSPARYPPAGSRSLSERTASRTNVSPAMRQLHTLPTNQTRSKSSPLGRSSLMNAPSPATVDAPVPDSLLFSSVQFPISRGDEIMRRASPLPPLSTTEAKRMVRVTDGRGARRSVRVAEVGVMPACTIHVGSSPYSFANGGKAYQKDWKW